MCDKEEKTAYGDIALLGVDFHKPRQNVPDSFF
jgi:hypothetical protein